MNGETPLLPGGKPTRVLDYDNDPGILRIKPGEEPICPVCLNQDNQQWECGDPDSYEMTCLECGSGYGVLEEA